jgi:hypothetical protein
VIGTQLTQVNRSPRQAEPLPKSTLAIVALGQTWRPIEFGLLNGSCRPVLNKSRFPAETLHRTTGALHRNNGGLNGMNRSNCPNGLSDIRKLIH